MFGAREKEREESLNLLSTNTVNFRFSERPNLKEVPLRKVEDNQSYLCPVYMHNLYTAESTQLHKYTHTH